MGIRCGEMNLAVDARSLASLRGISRYTREMLVALDELDGVEVKAVVPDSRWANAKAALTGRPTIAKLTGADVVWMPAPAPGAPGSPLVLTVHDLSWIERPDDFTAYERLWHRLMRFERLLRSADAVVCDDGSVAAALGERFGVDATVVEPGVGVPDTLVAADRERPYFLYVGALEPRKGLDVLEQAWEQAGVDADLVLVGAGRSPIGVGEHLGLVPDDVLHGLYAGALAIVLPSYLEGFGFTPREAACHGVPSIVSDLPSLRLPGTLRVPPGDVDALAEAITVMPSVRESLVATLPAPRSWHDAATDLVAVLRSVHQ